MKYAVRMFTIVLFMAGSVGLIYETAENNRLATEVERLEAELGRMSIDDADRIHLVEIEVPDVPPEVASHVERVWQFRCYLPPGYDYFQLSGDGRVTKEGIYQSGGYGSSWGTPKPEAVHKLLTVSLQIKDDRLQAFYSFSGSGGTTSWNGFNRDHFDDLLIQKLVSSDRGPRSFDRDSVLPLLKIYDPTTAVDTQVAGKTLTTYAGGLIVLCPKSRETILNQLRNGEMPSQYDPSWIASEGSNE